MLFKVYKFIFSDIEQEEAWLNQMAQNGYNFQDNFLMRYTFTEGKPNEYIYRIELLEHHSNHPLSRKYLKFLEETGVECVTVNGRQAYFRKKLTDGPFDLYSDLETKIRHYKRNLVLTASILLANLVIVAFYITLAVIKVEPAAIIICIVPLFFSVILLRGVIHYVMKIKKLRMEQRIHE